MGAQRPGALASELRTDCSHVDCVLGAVLLQAVIALLLYLIAPAAKALGCKLSKRPSYKDFDIAKIHNLVRISR